MGILHVLSLASLQVLVAAATLSLSTLESRDVQLHEVVAVQRRQDGGETSHWMAPGGADTTSTWGSPAGPALMTETNEDPPPRAHSEGTWGDGEGSKFIREKLTAAEGGTGGGRSRSNADGNVTTPTPRRRRRRGKSPGGHGGGGPPAGQAPTGHGAEDQEEREAVLPPRRYDTLNRPNTRTTVVPQDRREKTDRAKMSTVDIRHSNTAGVSEPRSSPQWLPQATSVRAGLKPAFPVFPSSTYYTTLPPGLRPHLAYFGFIVRDTTPGFHGPGHQRPLQQAASGRDATIWIVMLSVACFLGGILLATVVSYGIYKRQWRRRWRRQAETPPANTDPQHDPPSPSRSESPSPPSRDDLEQLTCPKTTLLHCDVLSGMVSYNTNGEAQYHRQPYQEPEDSACLLSGSSQGDSLASSPDTTYTMISMDDLSCVDAADSSELSLCDEQLLHRTDPCSPSFSQQQENTSVT